MQAMRQVCVDLLGMVTAALHADQDASSKDAPWAAALLSGAVGFVASPSHVCATKQPPAVRVLIWIRTQETLPLAHR